MFLSRLLEREELVQSSLEAIDKRVKSAEKELTIRSNRPKQNPQYIKRIVITPVVLLSTMIQPCTL